MSSEMQSIGGSVILRADQTARILKVLHNQMQVFGADEEMQSTVSELYSQVDECGATELVEELLGDLATFDEQRTDELLDLQSVQRVLLKLEMTVAGNQLRDYGALPDVTVFGPLSVTSRACTRVESDEAGQPVTKITYLVIAQIDHEVLELMAPALHEQAPLIELFDIELTSPYWECLFAPKKTIRFLR